MHCWYESECVDMHFWYESECVDISKSKFFVEQIEYLQNWITRQGIQPIRNKVEAILNINAPKTRKAKQTTPVYWYSQLLSLHVVSQK
jgi:hypothetical protein